MIYSEVCGWIGNRSMGGITGVRWGWMSPEGLPRIIRRQTMRLNYSIIMPLVEETRTGGERWAVCVHTLTHILHRHTVIGPITSCGHSRHTMECCIDSVIMYMLKQHRMNHMLLGLSRHSRWYVYIYICDSQGISRYIAHSGAL